MPVTHVGRERVVETGTFVLMTGVRTGKISFSAATLLIEFGPYSDSSFAQGDGPDDFIIRLQEPRGSVETYWAGTVEDGGTIYKFAVVARAHPSDTPTAVAVHYTISIYAG